MHDWLAQPPPTDDPLLSPEEPQEDLQEEEEKAAIEEEPADLPTEEEEPLIQDHPDIIDTIFPACQVHLIGGSPGAGKTAFESWMYRHIVLEQPFLGHPTHYPISWAYLIYDRSADDRLLWWKKAGVKPPSYYCLADDPDAPVSTLRKMSNDQSFAYLKRKIQDFDLPPGSAVTIDVANPFVGDVRQGYRQGWFQAVELTKFAHEQQLTLFLILHGGKQKGGDQRYARLSDRIIASAGFLGGIGTICYLASQKETDPKGELQEFEWRPHHAPEQNFMLKRDSNGLYFPFHGVRTLPHPTKKAAEELPSLADNYFPTPPGEVPLEDLIGNLSDVYGWSKSTIIRRVNDLVDRGLVEKVRHGYYRRRCES